MPTPLAEASFVVCDVETTGMSAASNRITEIGLIAIEKGRIADAYTALVNPGQFIPPFISQMTGITNLMVQAAPPFEELLPDVRRFLDGRVFVAHNAAFDWSFIRSSMLRASGDPPTNRTLCTVRLARRITPGEKSYSLASLVRRFRIRLERHHSASADAQATAELFLKLLEKAGEDREVETLEDLFELQKPLRADAKLPRGGDRLLEQANALPEEPGVYRFVTSRGTVVYVGKALNLRHRVRTYFTPASQRVQKIRAMLRGATRIEHETTTTELAAIIREAALIKELQPRFNSAMTGRKEFPFLRLDVEDAYPRLTWTADIEADGAEYFGPLRSTYSAELVIDLANRLFTLRKCEDKLKPSPDFTPCLYHGMHRCNAPCAKLESREDYLKEVDRVRAFLSSSEENIVATLEARMQAHAENLEFEEAAALRDRLREFRVAFAHAPEVAPDVGSRNLVLIVPIEGTPGVELTLIRGGRLAHSQRITPDSSEDAVAALQDKIESVFYGEPIGPFTQKEAREIRMVAAWLHSSRERGTVVRFRAEEKRELFLTRLRSAISKASS